MKQQLNVYLVDDDKIFSVIAKASLKKIYKNVNFFYLSNAKQALEKLQECPDEDWPSILFLDINMPIMSGWEFLATVDLSNDLSFPICMTSSSIDPGDLAKADSHPKIIGFLEKPFDKVKVKELIDSVV